MQDQNKKNEYLDEYKIIKQLGSGYQAIVKLGVDLDGNYVAIKKFKKQPTILTGIEEELSVMEQLHHENLIKLISVRHHAVYRTENEEQQNCFAIVIEYAEGGELFDFIADTGKFSEKVARTYFHQLMNGIHYMHQRGFAHRDIKPENILLSSTFVLKIADFGFSCLLKGRDGRGVLKTKLGTEGYMAPQISQKQYQGKQIDIFAAGVILFIMYSGSPPFEKASPNDPHYKLIRQKKFDLFWESHQKRRSLGYFSEPFKNLVQGMIASQPSQRPNILQIAKHPWVKNQICTHSQIIAQFTQRKQRLSLVLEQRRKENQNAHNALSSQIVSSTSISSRGLQTSSFVEDYVKFKVIKHEWPQLEMVNSDDIVLNDKNTEFVFVLVKQYLEKQKIRVDLGIEQQEELIEKEDEQLKTIKVNSKNGTIKASYVCQYIGQDVIDHQIKIEINFGKTKQGKTIIHFEPKNKCLFQKIIIKNIQRYCLQ